MEGILTAIFLVGCSVGSFLNVCIDRLTTHEDIVRSRSHCDYCKRILSWYELIPIVSWVIQRGKSRCCGKSLSIQYPLLELLTGAVFVVLAMVFSSTPLLFVSSLCVAMSFIVLLISDVKYELLPSPFFLLWGFGAALRFIALRLPVTEILFGYGIPAFCAGLFFFFLWFASRGRAMGDGDIWLAALIGLVVGYPGILIALYTAFLTGAIVGVILILGRFKTLKSHIPFGPFLLLGMVVTLVWQKDLLFLLSNYWL